MVMGRFTARTILCGCAAAIVSTIVVGGVALAMVEGVGIFDGIWLAFNLVATTGFGDGPQTTLGHFVSMLVFLVAACSWFGVLVVAIEVGNMRFQRYSLIDEALRPLARRPRNRLFHTN